MIAGAAEMDKNKEEEKRAKAEQQEAFCECSRLARRKSHAAVDRWAMKRRAGLFRYAFVSPRPIKVPIAEAKSRIAGSKAAAVAWRGAGTLMSRFSTISKLCAMAIKNCMLFAWRALVRLSQEYPH